MKIVYWILFCAGLLLASGCSRQVVPAVAEVATEPQALAPEPNHPVEQLRPGFAGSDSCLECHEHHYQTWYDSYHRTMTTFATPETVKGNFSNKVTSAYGTVCIMEREGDDYWIEMQSSSKTVRRQIKMVTGSHHMQVYWFPTDNMRVLGMSPVVWINDDQEWIPRDAAFLKPPQQQRSLELFRWSVDCIRCHVTDGVPGLTWDGGYNPQRAPDHMDTHASEFGISCEACHGPGAVHVALRQKLGDKVVDNDPMLVPNDLNPALSSQACGQCHSIRLFGSDEKLERFVTNGMEFCVGMTLEESEQYVWDFDDGTQHPLIKQALAEKNDAIRGYFWPDGMVRVSGREYNGLIKSPCYTHGDTEKQLSCFDCHQMHQGKSDPRPRAVWADDQLKVGEREGASCIRCHQGFDQPGHTHHQAGSSGSNCLNCHMPYTTYGLLKAIRSHTISSPSVQESIDVGRPNACNQCHLDKSLAWTGDHLKSWYDIESPDLNDKQRALPASLLWLYQGDAGLRALTAWSMAWEDARAASGSEWMAKPLIDTLDDAYDAVRFIAFRSLKEDPAFADFSYDFMAPDELIWRRIKAAHAQDPHHGAWWEKVDQTQGSVSEGILDALSVSRDRRPVRLLE